MANGEAKPGDAAADKWRERFEKLRRDEERALDRLDVRADMKSMGEDEISEVIEQRTLERQQKREGSDPPPSKATPLVIVLAGVRKMPAWGVVIVALAAIAAYVFIQTR